MTAFPSKEATAEAYRAVHNLHAQYQGLGTLREALVVYKAAAEQYEGLQAELVMLNNQVKEARASTVALGKTHAARMKALEEQYKNACAPLEARKEALEHEVTTLTARVTTLQEEERALADRKTALQADIDDMFARYRR